MATNNTESSSSSASLPSQRLLGKVALITGGATGIGESTVRLFHKHGAKVCIVDLQDDLGNEVCKSLLGGESKEETACFIHGDVRVEDDISNAVDFAVKKFGTLDILVNNAGLCGKPCPDIRDHSLSEFELTFDVNVKGTFLGMKHAARVMIPKKKGSIVSLCSVGGVMGGVGPHAYVGSKHAILGLTRNVAAELGQHGIRVNCVSPYAVATNLALAHLPPEERTEDTFVGFRNFAAANANLKGVELTVDDVANAVLFLASDESRYISGDNLMIDGGFTCTNHSFRVFRSFTRTLAMDEGQGGRTHEQTTMRARKRRITENIAGTEEVQHDERPRQSAHVRRIPSSINNLTAPTIFVPTQANPPVSRKLEAFVGEDQIIGNGYYKAFELNIKNAILCVDDKHQTAVYYAAAVFCLVPSLKNAITATFEKLGHDVNLIVLPRDIDMTMGENMNDIIDVAKAHALWGLIIIMLFKKSSTVNFTDFKTKRMRALRAVSNVIDDDDMEVFLDVESAQQFATSFGQLELKREILLQVMDLASQRGSLSQVANYVKSILQWTELAGFVFIFSTLILTKSPLLWVDELRTEVKNYHHAMVLLTNFEYPPYYKILGPPDTFNAFERKNFPTLMAVALELKAKTTRSVAQFVSPLTSEDVRIRHFVETHEKERKIDLNKGIELDRPDLPRLQF